MNEKTLDDILLDGIKEDPGAYGITSSEYALLIKTDFIINSITKNYIAVGETGPNSVTVTMTTPRDIIKALRNAGINIDEVKRLAVDVFNGRKWFTTLLHANEAGIVNASCYILLKSDNERREVKYTDVPWMEHDIRSWAAALQIPDGYRYIPPFAWNALKQIAIVFERGENNTDIIPANFRTIRQGPATNALTKISTVRNKYISIDDITGLATIERGGLTVNIADYMSKGIKIKASTHRLLDALTVRFAETGAKSSTVQMPLKEYMELCGLSDEKEARKQAKEDLEALYSLTLSFKGKGKHALDFADFRLCDYKGIANGIIIFNYSLPFYGVLKQYPIMRLPNGYFKLNSKRNPNSPYFLRKISELKNMNATGVNEDLISVQTLLNSTDELPRYEDIASTGRIDQRIIRPFERDLDALQDILTWEYCHSKGEPLSAAELSAMDYSTFSELLIKVKWLDYPAEVAQKALERKEQAKAKAAPKKRGRPKKNPG